MDLVSLRSIFLLFVDEGLCCKGTVCLEGEGYVCSADNPFSDRSVGVCSIADTSGCCNDAHKGNC